MDYAFHINEWLPRFPLDDRAEYYHGEQVTGPGHVCNNELLRREMQDQYHWGEPVPVDIFIMADGEPDDRRATKIGGLPFRPANVSWPTDAAGEPMLFLAQFNFTRSQDLTGRLPGDLLLVFADDSSGMIEDLQFEWQPKELPVWVDNRSVPRRADGFDPCFGYIYRTLSFPAAETAMSRDDQQHPQCRGKDVWSDYFLLQWQATQIGRAPFFIQGDPELPGRLLCTISSVNPNQHQPYPWVNHPDPLMPEDEWDFNGNRLMIGDAGCIYISIDDQQKLHWCDSCF